MSSIYAGGLVTKDPNSVEVFTFDWDQEELAASVEITTSDFFITCPNEAVPLNLTSDNETILTGNRRTSLRLSGGTAGKRYTVTNRIVTNETPSQTKDASFTVKIESR